MSTWGGPIRAAAATQDPGNIESRVSLLLGPFSGCCRSTSSPDGRSLVHSCPAAQPRTDGIPSSTLVLSCGGREAGQDRAGVLEGWRQERRKQNSAGPSGRHAGLEAPGQIDRYVHTYIHTTVVSIRSAKWLPHGSLMWSSDGREQHIQLWKPSKRDQKRKRITTKKQKKEGNKMGGASRRPAYGTD